MKRQIIIITLIVLSFIMKSTVKAESGRIAEKFNRDWEFVRLPELHLPVRGKTIQEEIGRIPGQSWEPVILPHTARIESREVTSQWQGICYYRKRFLLSEEYADKKVFLTFEGAMQEADVWINGKHMRSHAGGYTPFSTDCTDLVNVGVTNTIIVRLDNRDNGLIPPGKPVSKLDFCYYGGIYRDVYLTATGPVYITDPVEAGIPAGGGIFVTCSNVTENSADIHIAVHVRNDSTGTISCGIAHEINKSRNYIRKSSSSWGPRPRTLSTEISELQEIPAEQEVTFKQTLTVDEPRLWLPAEPNLYEITTVVLQNNTVVDSVTTRIGIRRLEYSREEGFKLNGKAIPLRGTNRHQEYPWIGNALSDNASYRDILKIKEAGFNIVRLGHYPQDPAVLDACDELGLLVIEPIPGWQYFTSATDFVERTYQDIRDLIRRDRNHPCVCMWEVILNESWPPAWWKDRANEIAHEEYPGPQCFTAGDMYGYYGWDILYNDWNENHTRPNESGKPGFIREYGDYEFGGENSTTRQRWGAGEQALLKAAWNVQWSHNKHLTQYPWTIGDANWCMFDHNRGCAPGVSACGNSDIMRLPKFAYYFFKSQIDPVVEYEGRTEYGSMVYIANYWTERTSPCTVVVFSNCEEVALELNGSRIACRMPDNGPDTPYHTNNIRHTGGTPFDGGNCRQLAHPPFTFKGITWEKGTLQAVGYINGKKATKYTVRTPGKPAGIFLKADEGWWPLKADGADAIFIYGQLLDTDNATVVTDNETKVTFDVTGPARIVSPTTVQSEAGIATILLQSTGEPGEVIVTARSEGLREGVLKLKVQ